MKGKETVVSDLDDDIKLETPDQNEEVVIRKENDPLAMEDVANNDLGRINVDNIIEMCDGNIERHVDNSVIIPDDLENIHGNNVTHILGNTLQDSLYDSLKDDSENKFKINAKNVLNLEPGAVIDLTNSDTEQTETDNIVKVNPLANNKKDEIINTKNCVRIEKNRDSRSLGREKEDEINVRSFGNSKQDKVIGAKNEEIVNDNDDVNDNKTTSKQLEKYGIRRSGRKKQDLTSVKNSSRSKQDQSGVKNKESAKHEIICTVSVDNIIDTGRRSRPKIQYDDTWLDLELDSYEQEEIEENIDISGDVEDVFDIDARVSESVEKEKDNIETEVRSVVNNKDTPKATAQIDSNKNLSLRESAASKRPKFNEKDEKKVTGKIFKNNQVNLYDTKGNETTESDDGIRGLQRELDIVKLCSGNKKVNDKKDRSSELPIGDCVENENCEKTNVLETPRQQILSDYSKEHDSQNSNKSTKKEEINVAHETSNTKENQKGDHIEDVTTHAHKDSHTEVLHDSYEHEQGDILNNIDKEGTKHEKTVNVRSNGCRRKLLDDLKNKVNLEKNKHGLDETSSLKNLDCLDGDPVETRGHKRKLLDDLMYKDSREKKKFKTSNDDGIMLEKYNEVDIQVPRRKLLDDLKSKKKTYSDDLAKEKHDGIHNRGSRRKLLDDLKNKSPNQKNADTNDNKNTDKEEHCVQQQNINVNVDSRCKLLDDLTDLTLSHKMNKASGNDEQPWEDNILDIQNKSSVEEFDVCMQNEKSEHKENDNNNDEISKSTESEEKSFNTDDNHIKRKRTSVDSKSLECKLLNNSNKKSTKEKRKSESDDSHSKQKKDRVGHESHKSKHLEEGNKNYINDKLSKPKKDHAVDKGLQCDLLSDKNKNSKEKKSSDDNNKHSRHKRESIDKKSSKYEGQVESKEGTVKESRRDNSNNKHTKQKKESVDNKNVKRRNSSVDSKERTPRESKKVESYDKQTKQKKSVDNKDNENLRRSSVDKEKNETGERHSRHIKQCVDIKNSVTLYSNTKRDHVVNRALQCNLLSDNDQSSAPKKIIDVGDKNSRQVKEDYDVDKRSGSNLCDSKRKSIRQSRKNNNNERSTVTAKNEQKIVNYNINKNPSQNQNKDVTKVETKSRLVERKIPIKKKISFGDMLNRITETTIEEVKDSTKKDKKLALVVSGNKKTIVRNQNKGRTRRNMKTKPVQRKEPMKEKANFEDIVENDVEKNIEDSAEEVEQLASLVTDKKNTVMEHNEEPKQQNKNPVVKPLAKEFHKHIDNIKTILCWSNATPIRRFERIGYECAFCEVEFHKPDDLKMHTLDCHRGSSEAYFMKKNDMTNFFVKLDITDLQCFICCEKLYDVDALISHLMINHEKSMHVDIKNHIVPFKFDKNDPDTLTCYMCSCTQSKFKMLLEHVITNHCRNYICEICETGFVNYRKLQYHLRIHAKGTYKCRYCDSIFETVTKKNTHEKKHRGVKFKCSLCMEKFNDYFAKQRHMDSEHGIAPPKIVCKACSRVFTCRLFYSNHVNKHHLMIRKHSCSECDMKFYKRRELKYHMLKHTSVKDFQCEICYKMFTRKTYLVQHIRNHEDDFRFTCERCGNRFLQKIQWKTHMLQVHHETVN